MSLFDLQGMEPDEQSKAPASTASNLSLLNCGISGSAGPSSASMLVCL